MRTVSCLGFPVYYSVPNRTTEPLIAQIVPFSLFLVIVFYNDVFQDTFRR